MIIQYEQEKKLVFALCTSLGLSPGHADILAREVSYSDFSGVYSHGLSRFSHYCRHYQRGIHNPHPNIHITRDCGSAVVLDVDDGTGVLGVQEMYQILRKRVAKHGIVMGAAFRSSNIGCAAFYAKEAAEDNLILVLCANTGLLMAPYGGAEKLLGSNPIIVGVPAGREKPMILDMATSLVAFGKIQAARREGQPIPLGWALDRDGKPTTDAEAAYSLVPFGGPKGYCLAVMVDVFSSFLSGAATGSGIGFNPIGEKERSGFCMVLIDPKVFRPIEEFKETVDTYIREIKSSRLAAGAREIFMPGEIELQHFEENCAKGIKLPSNLCDELARIAAECGLAPEGAPLGQVLALLDGEPL